jgi:cyclohexadienyl dehydratase
MWIRWLALSVSLLASALVAAQGVPASRLDTTIAAGKIKVCSPGDYKPFSLQRLDAGFEGLDIDLIQAAAKALGVEVEMVKSS